MSRRAVVHIGIHKTGSSTLQSTFYSARDALLEAGILYPSVSGNLSLPLSTVFQDIPPSTTKPVRSPLIDRSSLEKTRSNFRNALEADVGRDNWNTVVFSAEGLTGFTTHEVVRFRDWLLGYVEEIYVIAYVRHPTDWARSAFQQRVKGGSTLASLHAAPPHPQDRKSVV